MTTPRSRCHHNGYAHHDPLCGMAGRRAHMSSGAARMHDADAQRDARIAEWRKKARAAAKAKQGRNLYIITLHPDVLECGEFRRANPGYREGMPCVYVGLTIHSPGDRYQQHKMGYRSSKYPKKYGVELALDVMDGFEPGGLTEEEQEYALADWLREQGYGVWQN